MSKGGDDPASIRTDAPSNMNSLESPSGALMCMPLLILSMGGEMIYILEQRLEAQKIQEMKGQKVLFDVIRTMYFPKFINELFKPQETYSMTSTRQIFDRLAHSSIMRLNGSSMDKLMDLMTMGFKFQFLRCSSGEEIVEVALNHVDAVKKIVTGNQELWDIVTDCEKLIHEHYGCMKMADYRSLRLEIANFLQDRKVKISLFLQDETQNMDGSIVVPLGGVLPFNALPPGGIIYVQQDCRTETAHGCVSAGRFYVDERRTSRVNLNARFSDLGKNLYSKDKEAEAAAKAAAAAQEAAMASGVNGSSPAAPRKSVGDADEAMKAGNKQVLGELNALASLIQPAKASGDLLKFDNFFGNDIKFGDQAGTLVKPRTDVVSPVKKGPTVATTQTGGTDATFQKNLKSVEGDLDNLGSLKKNEDDDLLDLLG